MVVSWKLEDQLFGSEKEVGWELLRELAKQTWTRQQRRAYQRILSGLRKHKGELLRFITLTTAKGMKRDIRQAFKVLHERIRRLTPLKLLKQGYITKDELKKYYPNKPLNEPIRFEYFKVETAEGVAGVLHILYFGDYIPQKWLSDVWRDITGTAYVVDIRACKDRVKSPKRLARYCISQYVAGQEAFVRYSWSHGWVGKGFVRIWRFIIDKIGDIKKALFLWNKLLDGEEIVLKSLNKSYIIKPDMRIVELTDAKLSF